MQEATPFYVSHRCGGGDWPELSALGITESLARGYKAFELSIWWTQDGEWVLAHDYSPTSLSPEHTGGWTTHQWADVATWEIGKRKPTHPYEGEPQHFMRLQDALAILPADTVLFIDHKATSDGEGNVDGQEDRDRLLDYLETVENPYGRVVWKTFSQGHVSAAKAKARGFQNWGIFYDDQTPQDLAIYDLLGMNHNATQEHWDAIKAYGKPVIGHIVETVGQHTNALTKGADGVMNSRPTLFP